MGENWLVKVRKSRASFIECERNLKKKLPDALPIFSQLIAAINPEIEPDPTLEESNRWVRIIEAKDAPILAAVVLAKVDRLLSLNTKDFTTEVGIESGLIIQTPAEFIREIREIVQRGL